MWALDGSLNEFSSACQINNFPTTKNLDRNADDNRYIVYENDDADQRRWWT